MDFSVNSFWVPPNYRLVPCGSSGETQRMWKVCVCMCFTIPEFYLGNQKWEESVVGILKDPTSPREEKNSPFSISAPLRS